MTDAEPPATTVVIPVWGEYVTLRFQQALASIATQDLPAQIIVVDNASSVQLPALDGVRVVATAERVSLGAARNLGLAQVATDTVIFADADDLMLPGTLRRLHQGLASDPRLVAFALPFLDAESGRRHRWPRRWVARLVRFPTLLALVNAVWAVYPITGPVVVRTALARRVGGHAEVDNGDARCLGAALLFCGRAGWDEEPGCVYHTRPGSNLDRFSGAAAIVDSARQVRARLRSEFGGPRWLPWILPLIAAGQWLALIAHLLVTALRPNAGRAGRAGRRPRSRHRG